MIQLSSSSRRQRLGREFGKQRPGLEDAGTRHVRNDDADSADHVDQPRYAEPRDALSSSGSRKLESTRRRSTSARFRPAMVRTQTRPSRTARSSPSTSRKPR